MSGTVAADGVARPARAAAAWAARSPLALLSGSHEVKVWYGGADKIRVAMPTQMGETNLIVNGDQALVLGQQRQHRHPDQARAGPAGRPGPSWPRGTAPRTPPQAAAQEMLARPASTP